MTTHSLPLINNFDPRKTEDLRWRLVAPSKMERSNPNFLRKVRNRIRYSESSTAPAELSAIQNKDGFRYYLASGDEDSLKSLLFFSGEGTIEAVEAMFGLVQTGVRTALFRNYAYKYGGGAMEKYFDISTCCRIAARTGDFESVENYLTEYSKNFYHFTWLYINAAAGGQLEIVKFFFNHPGMRLEGDHHIHINAIREAAKGGFEDVIDYILANVRLNNDDAVYEILLGAFYGGQLDLIRKYFPPNSPTSKNEFYARQALRGGNKDAIDYIWKIFHPNSANMRYYISAAVEGGNLETVKMISAHTHDVRDNIREAASYGHFDVVEYLIDRSPNDNTRFFSAITGAISGGHLAWLKRRFPQFLDPNSEYYDGEQPGMTTPSGMLRTALRNQQLEIIEYILSETKLKFSDLVYLGSWNDIARAVGDRKDIARFILNNVSDGNNIVMSGAATHDNLDIFQMGETGEETKEFWNDILVDYAECGAMVHYAISKGADNFAEALVCLDGAGLATDPLYIFILSKRDEVERLG